jgi:hypothetical protein
MDSKIIGDAMYQELNMAFSFDEQDPSKIIVYVVADRVSYQL